MFASLGLMPLSLAAAGATVQWNLQGMFAKPTYRQNKATLD
jgi:hypothetical protein